MSAINEEKTGKKDIKCYETEKNTKKHGINSESEKFYTAVEYLRLNTSKWEQNLYYKRTSHAKSLIVFHQNVPTDFHKSSPKSNFNKTASIPSCLPEAAQKKEFSKANLLLLS